MNLLQLGSYFRRRVDLAGFNEGEIYCFLLGMKFCGKRLTTKNIDDLLFYVFPANNAKNYTEIDEKLPIVKKRLKNKNYEQTKK